MYVLCGEGGRARRPNGTASMWRVVLHRPLLPCGLGGVVIVLPIPLWLYGWLGIDGQLNYMQLYRYRLRVSFSTLFSSANSRAGSVGVKEMEKWHFERCGDVLHATALSSTARQPARGVAVEFSVCVVS